MTPLLCFAVWVAGGYQLLGPWRFLTKTSHPPETKKVAGFAALLWLTLAVVVLGSLALDPDPALPHGLVPPWTERPMLLAGVLTWAAALGGDLVLLVGTKKLGMIGRWLLASVSVLALLVASLGVERLRQGAGPPLEGIPLGIAVVAGFLLSLAGGELLLPGKPFWAVPAAPALLIWHEVLAPQVAANARFLQPTLWMGSALLIASRFLPQRFQRSALGLGLVLAALWLDRVAAVSHSLSERLELFGVLLWSP